MGFSSLNLIQVEGGRIIKQSDRSTPFSFILTDSTGNNIYLDGKEALISLRNPTSRTYWETTTRVKDSTVEFKMPGNLIDNKYILEISCDGYVFPSDNEFIIDVKKGYAELLDGNTATLYKKTVEEFVKDEAEKAVKKLGKTELRGEKGDRGYKGDKGEPGDSITISSTRKQGRDTVITFSDNTVITVQDGIDGKTGPTGPQGERGLPGPTGPQGPKGKDGTMTFADLTEEQKESLRGPRGLKGDNGKGVSISGTSYDENGNTVVKFTDNTSVTIKKGVKGERGPVGPKGDNGSSLSIVNNLTDGGKDKALSAEQGKILFQYANDGKEKIANAIVGKGAKADKSESFDSLANKIGNIKTGYGSGDVIPKDKIKLVDDRKLIEFAPYDLGERIIDFIPFANCLHYITETKVGYISYDRKYHAEKDTLKRLDNRYNDYVGLLVNNDDGGYVYYISSSGCAACFKNGVLDDRYNSDQIAKGLDIKGVKNFIPVRIHTLFFDGKNFYRHFGSSVKKIKLKNFHSPSYIEGEIKSTLPGGAVGNYVHCVYNDRILPYRFDDLDDNELRMWNLEPKISLNTNDVEGGIYRSYYNDYVFYTPHSVFSLNGEVGKRPIFPHNKIESIVPNNATGEVYVYLDDGTLYVFGKSIENEPVFKTNIGKSKKNLKTDGLGQLFFIDDNGTSIKGYSLEKGKNHGDCRIL